MHLPPLRHLAAATLLACATLSAQAQVTTGAMTTPRMFHQASTLQDGRVLVTGGAASPSSPLLASTEVYDLVSGAFMPMAPMLVPKREHAAITLKDGRVLVAGGMVPNGTVSSFAEIFDPATGQWSATGQMNTGYFRTMARLLPDGRVMVASRDNTGHHAEIFDPAKGSFSKSGDMVETTSWHGMVVLADGRVLKVGGYTANGYSRNAEIWDPSTNKWTATGQMGVERQDIQPVLLPDGKVLVAGGRNSMKLKSTEIYDPATGKFSPGYDMPMPFAPDSNTVLGNGTIVFTDPHSRELQKYEPPFGSWGYAGLKRDTARESIAARLPDGGLLLAGGAALNDATSYAAVLDQACTGKQLYTSISSAEAPADGGAVGFTVTGAPGCRFEVANQPDWLALETPNPTAITENWSAAVGFKAAPNMSITPRTASFLVGNQPVTVTQPISATCPSMPYVTPGTVTIGNQGGTGTANVSAPVNCSWNIAAAPSFATITSGSSGKGNGSFTYSVPANPLSTSRSSSGLLSALGQTSSFVFTQDGSGQCPSPAKLTFSSLEFPASGGAINVGVSAAPTCPWNVSILPAWVKLATAGSGTGNGSFTLTAGPNGEAERSGTAQVDGPIYTAGFQLTQAFSPCANWSVSPTTINAPGAGTSGSISITAPASCNWNLSSGSSWVRLLGTNWGSGNGTVTYAVDPNSGSSRSSQLSLTGLNASQAISVNQAAAPVQTCTKPIASGVPANGYLQSSGCAAGARGASYYTDRYTFNSEPGRLVTIAVSSTAFDTYVYLRNPAGTVIRSDDDSGGGTNSRLSFTLPAGTAGTYTIEVTSYYAGKSGAYTVSLTQ